ncbi:MAG TPA: phosphonate metabolism protein/1,5-bisphosphokinase (PRPP-forming) PhnN [Kiloniellaceae bacterium]|nr:phosphonate metabolism protein/1,5-bisphosphokinase (PRPP-forming) PhnN [Kiloniellaceae bacterium]HIP80474.1 phosphonate metabolism protein/1,5-bisphosphokinase (PRPP-forming) PhnN [Kiloniellaceae bacterium]
MRGRSPGPSKAASGHLVLVVGPSGAGKDSLINGARLRLSVDERYVFPSRIITRISDPASEAHETVDEEQYESLKDSGAFFLHWGAHTLRYALPASVAEQLDAGATVIANVSRAVIAEALRKHPKTTVVLVTAPQAVLEERLLARGREDLAAVRRRLARSASLPPGVRAVTIVNGGSLEAAVDRFVDAVSRAPADDVTL